MVQKSHEKCELFGVVGDVTHVVVETYRRMRGELPEN